ncbi:MAG TPA: hypothetical protein DEB31_07740 [Clostridiales bacterium]|nr:hypothetical protein [Clostridiales bacterium]
MAIRKSNREMTTETISHDLTIEVVRTTVEGYQQGNDFQVSDVDIARFAVSIYNECFPIIRELIEKEE